jgi:non-ribosomal peptide synthetase component F
MKLPGIHEIFDEAVAEHGERTAISQWSASAPSPARSLTYAELACEANRLAHSLHTGGLSGGARIAVCSLDTPALVTSLLAILKAQSVFIPLDPELPAARLAAMLGSVRPHLIICAPAFFPALASALRLAHISADILPLSPFADAGGDAQRGDGDVLRLRRDLLASARDASADASTLRLDFDPDQMAYIYFTSGSTGTPKGIAGRLKAIAHFINWERRALALDHSTRAAQLVHPCFDAFLRDIFVPLSVGGTICALPERRLLLDPAALLRWLDF